MLSSAKKEELVSSFLDVAIGQTNATARCFLAATKWRVEDALESYFAHSVVDFGASSSCVRPVGLIASLDVANRSSCSTSSTSHGPSTFLCQDSSQKQGRPHNSHFPNPTTTLVVEPTVAPRVENAMNISLLVPVLGPCGAADVVKRPRGRPRKTQMTTHKTATCEVVIPAAEISASVGLSVSLPGHVLGVSGVAESVKRKRGRPRNIQLISHQITVTRDLNPDVQVDLPISLSESVVMQCGATEGVKRRRGRPCKSQLSPRITSVVQPINSTVELIVSSMPDAMIESTSMLEPLPPASVQSESHRKKRFRTRQLLPLSISTQNAHVSTLPVPPRCHRTRIQIDADAGKPRALRQHRACIRRVVDPVCKGIGMSHILPSPLILAPPKTCRFCNATKFEFESPNLCCGLGSIRLAQVEINPQVLHLFRTDDAIGLHFRQYSRVYNNYFAFSCLGGNITCSNAKGFFTFVLQGQIYHFVPNLLAGDAGPKFMQLYFYDGAPEMTNRCNNMKELRPDLISFFINVTNSNPYARFFRSLRTFPITKSSEIRIFKNTTLDQRVYNAPTSDEVAAIIADDDGHDCVNSPHILVYGKADHEHRIMHYYGCYDPLQYPLLFSRGESGWHQGLKRIKPKGGNTCDDIPFPLVPNVVQSASDVVAQEAAASSSRPPKEGKEVSCRAYYAYRFQIRPNDFLVNTGRIFTQYIVDMYVKVENTRLDYLKHNQTLLRSELYQGIVDSVNDGTRSASEVGKRVILPATFIGGPRDMKCRFLNAMALVQKFGKPNLFGTMTCNPNWPEIKDNLGPGENFGHRPDLVARVFNAKVRQLRRMILEYKIFGPVVAMVSVIEFQKRGLPHLHMLIILAKGSKITKPESFDQYVSAEIPSKENAHLRSLVIKHMMHGPCGDKGPDCVCMQGSGSVKKCKCNYPKDYVEHTTSTDDSYPIYRRRNNGDSVLVKGQELDNAWVVPFNPYLLSAFDCHINVEICSSIQAVKYLYKYIYKGHDKVCFDIAKKQKHVEDEITSYQSGRWVSGPESAWRIFGFDLYSMNPVVIPLQVHLPHMHTVTFSARQNLETIVNNDDRKRTMLTEFFTANRVLPNAKKYLYSKFPKYFTWADGLKAWHERKSPKCVGRLVYVNPCEGERYYLRLLLQNIRDPTSFEDLLTYKGVQYNTFKEVADKYSLFDKDDYAESCMREAVQVQMPCALRMLFATLLIFCDSVNAHELWDEFFPSLSEDFSHAYKDQPIKILYLTYSEIEKYLESMGKEMADFRLNVYAPFDALGLKMTRDINDALAARIPPQYVDAHMSLNTEQKIAYDTIVHHVECNIPGAFFIDGPGGTGKTFLYCALYASIRCMGKIVLPTATSGIATSNMPTGRTAHSRFKIPINQSGLVTCNVSKQSSLACLLRACSLIIWDEASMAKKDDIESLDRLLRDICDSNQIFGGKIIVFGGDFRQVLPVLPHRLQIEIVNSSLVSSYLWPQLRKFKLHANIRAKEDVEFADFLLQLGNGSLQTRTDSAIALPDILTCYPIEDDSFASLIDVMYPEMKRPHFDPDIFSGRSILTPTNEGADTINAAIIAFWSNFYIHELRFCS